MTTNEMLSPELSRASMWRPRLRALCVLAWVGTALACNGSVDTQGVGNSRPGTKQGSAGSGAGDTTSSTGTAPGAAAPSGLSPNEQDNDISGISGGAAASGGSRRGRARPPPPADAGARDAGADDAGADDAGAIDAGDAGAALP